MFRNLAGLGTLLKQAQQMGARMQQLNEELRNRKATGSAGGGMVEVEINGALEVLACRLNPQLVEDKDRELMEDLLVAAMNQAVAKARQLHTDAMKELTGGLDMPGLNDMLAKLSPGADEPPAS